MKVVLALALLAATAAAFVAKTDGMTGTGWNAYNVGTSSYLEKCVTGVCNYDSLGKAVLPGYCYLYVYPELGCTGEPLQLYGAQPGVAYEYWWDNNQWQQGNMRVQNNGATVSMYACDDIASLGTCSTVDLPGNFPVGCTDFLYIGQLAAQMDAARDHFRWAPTSLDYTAQSVFVVCNGAVECPRECEGVACGTYDSCDRPCVGSCDDGYYCAVDVDDTEFVCKPAQYGTSSWFTRFELPSGGKRFHSQEPYYEPTITHLENALVHDLSYATEGIVPPEAIVIDNIDFYAREAMIFNLEFTINVDTVNSLMGSSYTVEQLSAYLQENVFFFGNENKKVGYPLGGPFTLYMDLSATFPTADVSGVPASSTTVDSDEWVDVIIPSSWLFQPSSMSGASSVVASWFACLAVAALLLW